MKRSRIVFYAMMPVLLVMGLYTGITLFYTVLFVQLLLLAAVFALDLWTVKTFRYTQTLGHQSAVTGGKTTLHIEIINDKPIPMSLMEIAVETVSRRENHKLVFSLAPFAQKDFDIPVTMPYRGVYQVGMTTIRITDIFGLMSLRFDMRKLSYYRMQQLIIYPKAEVLGGIAARMWDTKLFGAAYLKQAESGDSASGTRAYRPGDALKRVNWKVSRRLGELYVKQYEVPEREKTFILLDSCVHELKDEPALYYADTMCRCAASIALYSISVGMETTLAAMLSGGGISSCGSAADFEPLYKWLATLPYTEEDRIYEALGELSGREPLSLFVLTRTPKAELIERLIELSEYMNSVTLVLVDDEERSYKLHTIYVNTGEDAADSLGIF